MRSSELQHTSRCAPRFSRRFAISLRLCQCPWLISERQLRRPLSLVRRWSSRNPYRRNRLTPRDAFLAWISTKQAAGLRSSSKEERFASLYKHILTFLDDDINVNELFDAMRVRRRRARMRSCGLNVFLELMKSTYLSSVKREIISSLVPSFSWDREEVLNSTSPDVLFDLSACGVHLSTKLTDSLRDLYSVLLDILKKPFVSGGRLLQATLHAFALDYENDELFKLVNELGIFPTLNKLLSAAG